MKPRDISSVPLLLLAGGRSSRMRLTKGLLNIAGEPLFHWQLRRFSAAGGARAVVVLGFNAEEYLAAGLPAGLDIVTSINPEPDIGPFSSIQDGWRRCEVSYPGSPGAFVLPVDVPAPLPCGNQSVWELLGKGEGLAAVPVFKGRGGHPVWLSRAFMGMLMQQPAGDRLDHLLARQAPGVVARIEVADASVSLNLNTPQDWDLTLPRLLSSMA